MKPIHITIAKKRPLVIIPDSHAHVDGHPVLTYTYSIYRDRKTSGNDFVLSKEASLHLEKNDDPDYMGYITFEQPGRMFTYTADGATHLESNEVQEIIEQVSEYRDTPDMWQI